MNATSVEAKAGVMDARELADGKVHDIELEVTEAGICSTITVDGVQLKNVRTFELSKIDGGELTTVKIEMTAQKIRLVGKARIEVEEHVHVNLIPPHPDRPEEGDRVIQDVTPLDHEGGYRQYEIVKAEEPSDGEEAG